MASVTSKCITKKEYFNVRLSEFQYDYLYRGDHSSGTSDTFNIICKDHDLELTWKIHHTYDVINNNYSSHWDKISIDCDKKIHGNVVIFTGKSCEKHLFDTELSSKFEKELFNIYCYYNNPSSRIKITFEIYREYKVFSTTGNYDKLLQNKQTSDVTFAIGDEEIHAHKQILSAQSDVFASMFYSDMMEKKTGIVKVIDIEPTVFKLLLNFIYTLKLDSNETNELLQLIVAADKYSVKSLVDVCGYRLANNLSIDKAAEVLIIADLVKAQYLKEDCELFIMKNKKAIGVTEGYKEMVKSRPDLLSEMFLQIEKNHMSD